MNHKCIVECCHSSYHLQSKKWGKAFELLSFFQCWFCWVLSIPRNVCVSFKKILLCL